VFNAPVGNPGEWEFVKLLPLAREAIKHDQFVVFGYHAYWAGDPQHSYQTREHWPYLQGRWDEIDQYLIANGYRVFWHLGEVGVVGGHPVGGTTADMSAFGEGDWTGNRLTDDVDEDGVPVSADPWKHATEVTVSRAGARAVGDAATGGYWLNPGSGWIDTTDCYGGNWARYLVDIGTFVVWCRETQAGREGRLLGMAFFTTGAPYTGWVYFQMQEAQWRAVAALA